MFDSLFQSKPSVQRLEDKIWQTADIKLTNLCSDASEMHREGSRVLIVAHFSNTIDRLKNLFVQKNMPLTYFQSAVDFGRWKEGYYQTIALAQSRDVPAVFDAPLSEATPTRSQIFVAEHHPLPEPDDRILRWADTIPGATLCFYDSLDAPMFQALNIAPVLEQLGIKNDESLSHKFITKAISAMQKKIAIKSPKQDFDAESAEAWWQKASQEGLQI